MSDKDKEKRAEKIERAGAVAGSADTVNRNGSAVKEFLVAYSGKDNSTGAQHKRSLKSISESKVNPKTEPQNKKQQAGFSAEVLSTAKKNAENASNGKSKTKSTRTDDMKKQSDGKGGEIGGTNDELYDTADVDANGNYVPGTGAQMKFVGKNAEDCGRKLMGKDYDKYIDNDVDIEVPKDYYEGVLKYLKKRQQNLEKQLEKLKKDGNTEQAAKVAKKLDRVKKTQKHVKKSNVTVKEAEFARNHPKLTTAKNIASYANKAGLQAAAVSAVVTAVTEGFSHVVKVIKGEETPNEAFKKVSGRVGKSAVMAYGTGFTVAAMAGVMQNAGSELIQSIGKSSLPVTIVSGCVDVSKILWKFGNHQIDFLECLTELGESGVGLIGSAVGGTIGSVVPGIGTIIGGMVGYALTTACYGTFVELFADEKAARIERAEKEAMARKIIAEQRAYQQELNQMIDNSLKEYRACFDKALSDMKNALVTGDANSFIGGANAITRKLGGRPLFDNTDEFDAFMQNEATLKL